MKPIFVIILFCFFSCKKEELIKSENKLKIEQPEKKSNEEDIRLFNKLISENYPYDSVNINSDNIPDYILYSTFGQKYFFDGKTKTQISAEIPLSKPGADKTLSIIDVNCGDNQKEFILQTAGGGTLGNYHGMEILRYNQMTESINSIFSSSISNFHWENADEVLDDVVYVDILYKKNKCNDTIKIYKGEFINKKESYNLEIKPKKLLEEYYFDEKTQRFEKNVS